MDFFALDGWIGTFFPDSDLSTLEKLNLCKPIFERLYHIEFDIRKKESACVVNGEVFDVIDEKKLNEVITSAFKHFNFSYYFNNGTKEKADFNIRDDINRHNMDEYFYDAILKRMIYNAAINMYISLKCKKGNQISLLELTANTKKEKQRKKSSVNKYDEESTDNSNFHKIFKSMLYHTVIGQLVGIKDSYNTPEIKKGQYSIPNYQIQLIRNLAETIKNNYFYTDIEDSIKKVTPTESTQTKSRIKRHSFFEDLLYKLDEADEIDRIVSYYIIERIFGFNLCHEMADTINNYYMADITDTADLLERLLLYKVVDEDEKRKFKNKIENIANNPEVIEESEKIIKACDALYKISDTFDIINDRKKIIEKFKILFKIPDISGRIDYFKRFVDYYNNVILKEENITRADNVEKLTPSDWQNECENYLKYVYYYVTPQVDFIFLYLYEKLREFIGDDKTEQMLRDYIVSNCIYPKDMNEYMRKVYCRENIDEMKNYKDTERYTDILSYAAGILLKTLRVENRFKYYEIDCHEDLKGALSRMDNIDLRHPAKIESSEKFLERVKELIDYKINNNEFHETAADTNAEKDNQIMNALNSKNINMQIDNIINEKNPFTKNAELKDFQESCDANFFYEMCKLLRNL